MEHLDEIRMIEVVWDDAALTAAERAHMKGCSECQSEFARLKGLHDELAVAHSSQVSPNAERRLLSLFTQVGQNSPQRNSFHHLLGELAGWVNALPLWDSRQQVGNPGVRNGSKVSYRMLFGAHETEVELMVEPANGLLRIVGEVMVSEAEGKTGLALIELMAAADAKSALETESDANGRFALEKVPPGRYVMTITPRYRPMLVIEPLELT